MSVASITISTKPEIKEKTKKVAKENGLTLNTMINSLLKLAISDVSIVKSIKRNSERPTPYLLKSIKTALQQKKEGKVSPRFSNSKDALKWLNRQHGVRT